MPELEYLKFEKAEAVARITHDRPKFNMMNIEMMEFFGIPARAKSVI